MCLGCGRSALRPIFLKALLGRAPLQASHQRIVDNGDGQKADGSRGGAMRWSKRPMNREEAQLVGRVVALGLKRLEEYLDSDLPEVPAPEQILAEIDDSDEFEQVAKGWLDEAEEELEYRREAIADELERRRSP